MCHRQYLVPHWLQTLKIQRKKDETVTDKDPEQ